MRGRLFLGGARGKTDVRDVLDCLAVFVMDTPGEQLQKWRDGLDRAVARATPARAAQETPTAAALARSSWGLAPHQIEATERFLSAMSGGERPSRG